MPVLSKTARVKKEKAAASGGPYKAIVVMYMAGGCDSFNLVVPHSNCGAHDLYADYKAVRTNAALAKTSLLQIAALPAKSQPCETFGLHPKLKNVQRMYNEFNAAVIANVGTLVEPITKAQFLDRSGKRPSSLYAHNVQTGHTQSVHAGSNEVTKGVLGRIVEALNKQGGANPLKTAGYSLAGLADILDGEQQANIMSTSGVTRFGGYSKYAEAIRAMTQNVSESIFAETYNKLLEGALEETEYVHHEYTHRSGAFNNT